ncbi:hypothetical protein LTR85_004431 [Meristemomyces frigidus]|nr:hypothetical protein LTR85_004431 [Meristemomyces frigidus]
MAASVGPMAITQQDRIMVWSTAITPAHIPPPVIRWYFLTPMDLLCARQLGFYQPYDVNMAYLGGNSADTECINFVVWRPNGDRSQGNAAYMAAIFGARPARFAPTREVAEAWALQGDGAPAEMPTVNPANPLDFTAFMASQAHDTRANPPAVAAILEPLKAFKTAVPIMKDRAGQAVNGLNGRPLRDLGHVLPRQISTQITKDGHKIAAWFLAEPRLIPNDIIDRMHRAIPPAEAKSLTNKIRQQAGRWRGENNVMSPEVWSGAKPSWYEMMAVRGLSPWQLEHNTGWRPDTTGQYIRLPGTAGNAVRWYRLPYPHPSSPTVTGDLSNAGVGAPGTAANPSMSTAPGLSVPSTAPNPTMLTAPGLNAPNSGTAADMSTDSGSAVTANAAIISGSHAARSLQATDDTKSPHLRGSQQDEAELSSGDPVQASTREEAPNESGSLAPAIDPALETSYR